MFTWISVPSDLPALNGKRMPPKFDKDEARRLRRDGMLLKEIGRRLGVSWQRVAQVCKEPAPDPRVSVREEARRLRHEGLLLREIAERLDRSQSAVTIWCDGIGISPWRRHKFDWQEAVRLRAEGLTLIAVAESLGVSEGAVWHALKAMRRISSQPEST